MVDITADALIAAERAERYKVQLDRPNTFPTEQNWVYIIENRMAAIAPQLYRKYLLSWLTAEDLRTDFHLLALKYFPEYITLIYRPAAIEAVYGDIKSSPEATLALINDCRLFDAPRLLTVLNDDDADVDPAPFVADCMAAYQPDYQVADLRDMKALYNAIIQLPPIGEIKESRGIFGRDSRYVCPHGHSNPADVEFCLTCGVDKNGFTETQKANIDAFRARIIILEKMFGNG